jgi:two-component system CheB/CheR fusion protein
MTSSFSFDDGHKEDASDLSVQAQPTADTGADAQLEALLEYLRDCRSFDFTGYKRPGLARRIRKRMQMLNLGDFESYLDYLKVHPHEFTLLFNTVLINVTGFFRDTESWAYLQAEIIPRLLASLANDVPLRVWCAGVASGEEAYTIAMILCEALGDEDYPQRVRIYATDVDEDALARARQGVYTASEVDNMPPDLLHKYFEPNGALYALRKNLRRAVIFGRHDLLHDASISRVDLLICRNTIMYFNNEAQARVLRRFYFALNDDGVLFLGRAEMLFAHSGLFVPIDVKRRLFTKRATCLG